MDVMEQYEYRLLAFHPADESREIWEDTTRTVIKNFRVQMFGLNALGQTACIYVTGFQPFFYIQVAPTMQKDDVEPFLQHIQELLGVDYGIDLQSSSLVEHKKLYGFDGGKLHKFLLIKFFSEDCMRKTKELWYEGTGDARRLLKDGFGGDLEEFNCGDTRLYEAQIPPLLRLFHIKEISPSGWIALPSHCVKKAAHNTALNNTLCDAEFHIAFTDIQALPEKETLVPYKICSFDIEASSSHGDFPLAIKDYKKLAENIVNAVAGSCTPEMLWALIQEAFFPTEENVHKKKLKVDTVYPQNTKVTLAEIHEKFQKWILIQPALYKTPENAAAANPRPCELDTVQSESEEEDDDDDIEQEAHAHAQAHGQAQLNVGAAGAAADIDDSPVLWRGFQGKGVTAPAYKKRGTIVDLLNDPEQKRETRLQELIRTLTATFPKLKGDGVTFIGSTFMRYGETTPYLNHCLVVNSCDPVDNAEIVSCATEKDLLLAWTQLIKTENPDIIIGYNIFGFDYQFMFLRARELKCDSDFLKLSRNPKEICWKYHWHNKTTTLEENTLVIASGQHELKYVKMTGRLQIDLFNYFRRDYQLSSYKLDYVAGYFLGDKIKKYTYLPAENCTLMYSENLTGLENGAYVNFEEEAHSVDAYKGGQKFMVQAVDKGRGTFKVAGQETPDLTKKVRWGLAKDDVTPQDIFRMTNEGPAARAKIAKYCIQDCNLVHHLLRKIDVMTGYVEMAKLCSVPLDFLVMRGQSIKLTSYVAKKCREKNTLMPVIDKGLADEGYEGATVLDPKCNLYLDDPVACVDYSSLYPSSMISENISHDSKVCTQEYNLAGELLHETGEKTPEGTFLYDNLPGYAYVDIAYNTYQFRRKNNNPKAAMEKVHVGEKWCRFAQFPKDPVSGERGHAVMPAILQELLAARKATRKLIERTPDEFMKNILDKRQLSIKVTANSLYGQTGAKTSAFYEKDCAASTTAMGRKLLFYGKTVIEEAFGDHVVETAHSGPVRTHAEYVYGDTDSVFFKFNLTELDGVTRIVGQRALALTIEIAQKAGALATQFLKAPHDLEYEKTFWPFALLSKKRYVGMLYEHDATAGKGKRKSMGIVLKRRDNAPIVKDIYGGVIDILMKEKNVETAVKFLQDCLERLVSGGYEMDKLVITKALRSGYKQPQKIAHNVLAERIGERDPGNKPSNGDRIAYLFIENPDKKALQGQRIETPQFIVANKLAINYAFYMTNQIMKPLVQLFALVLEQMRAFQEKKRERIRGSLQYNVLKKWEDQLAHLKQEFPDVQVYVKKEAALRQKEVTDLLFDKFLKQCKNKQMGLTPITQMFAPQRPATKKMKLEAT